jgi:hypothetical protein
MKKLFGLCSLVFLLMMVTGASAITGAINSSTAMVTLTYTEPTVEANGPAFCTAANTPFTGCTGVGTGTNVATPLTDLNHLNIYQNGVKLNFLVPASSATGGGVGLKVVVAYTAGQPLNFYMTAVNNSGVESIPSRTANLIPPAPPQ